MILDTIFRRSLNNPAVPLTGAGILSALQTGFRSRSGIDVTPGRMLEFGPMWQGVTLLGGDVGKTPCITYRRLADGRSRERAMEHPTYDLCRKSVGHQTSNLFFTAMVSHASLYGNAYARIRRGGPGFRPRMLEMIHSDYVFPRIENRAKFYQIKGDPATSGQEERLSQSQILHLPGTVIDALGGLSVVRYARDTVGAQLAASGYSDDFFSNNGIPHGFFEHPDEMSDGARKRFISDIINRHGGPGSQFKPGILEEGMHWKATGVSPKDAVLVDMLKIGPKQAAHYLNIPPHKVGDDSRVSYNSLEAEQRSYLESSLGVWFSKLEYEINDKLFRDDEQDELFVEFLQDARLKSDTKSRFETYVLAIQWGIMSPNEARERENLNPYPGGDDFKVHFSDGSATESDDEESEDEEPAEEPPADDDERSYKVRLAHRDLMFDRLNSMSKRLVNSGRQAAKKPHQFGAWVNGIRTQHEPAITDALRPVCQLAAATYRQDPDKMLRGVVDELIDGACEMFLRASECSEDELTDRVTNVTSELVARASDLATGTIGSE